MFSLLVFLLSLSFSVAVPASREQGELAADFLYQIWQGTAISDLPLSKNRNDRRYLNNGHP